MKPTESSYLVVEGDYVIWIKRNGNNEEIVDVCEFPLPPQAALIELLLRLMDGPEMIRHFRNYYPELSVELKVTAQGSRQTIAEGLVLLLERHGCIDYRMFASLTRARPNCQIGIATVAQQWHIAMPQRAIKRG